MYSMGRVHMGNHMKLKALLCILVWACFSDSSFAHEIAITFDDLPGQQSDIAAEQREITQRLLKALEKFQAPAIGFVNEGKLYSNNETAEKIAILKLWVDAGQPLGNHTYSHKFLSSSKITDYKMDVINGEKISKRLMSDAGLPFRYFRHPYLDTGTTKEIKSAFERFLKAEDYIVAPVTIDTDDWKFNRQLIENPHDKEKIIQEYLNHTKEKFAFYEMASKKIFGRNIRHIWLLHANLINSYSMDKLLQIAKDYGYTFITLDRALQDEAYSQPDNYYAPFGVSWLYRWDSTRGKVVDWSKEPEPGNNPFITMEETIFRDDSRARDIPAAIYLSGESKGKAVAGITRLPVVLMNHAYSIKNTEYSFLARQLAAQVYCVVSIQHDLPVDPELPLKGSDLFAKRKPFWERGVENLDFVIRKLRAVRPELNTDRFILIGHSNGGDIAMMFTDRYPDLVERVISLDSLRYPFPIKTAVPILYFRANDRKSDRTCVLPYRSATIIDLQDAKHVDLCDRGPEHARMKIVDVTSKYLKGNVYAAG